MLKFIFHVEDEAGEIVCEKSQIVLDILDEAGLQKLDDVDIAQLAKDNALIGECYANQASAGRSKYIREKFQVLGIIVSKFLDRKLSPYFGCKHIALLDSSKESPKHNVKEATK